MYAVRYPSKKLWSPISLEEVTQDKEGRKGGGPPPRGDHGWPSLNIQSCCISYWMPFSS